MSLGFFTILLTVVSVAAVFSILYFLAKNQTLPQHRPPIDRRDPSTKSHLQEIEIPKVPMYRKTKESMTRLKTEIDRLGDTFDMAFAKFRKETNGNLSETVVTDLKEMRDILKDAQKAATILLATVVDRPINEIEERKIDYEKQAVTSPPPFAAESIRDTVFKTFIALRETIQESKSCIAGFYFALTKKDKSARVAEAGRQIELLMALFHSAITKIDSLEGTQ